MAVKWQEWSVVHVSMFVTFILSALACNVINVLIYFIVKPLNLSLYRRLGGYLNWTINSQVGQKRFFIKLLTSTSN